MKMKYLSIAVSVLFIGNPLVAFAADDSSKVVAPSTPMPRPTPILNNSGPLPAPGQPLPTDFQLSKGADVLLANNEKQKAAAKAIFEQRWAARSNPVQVETPRDIANAALKAEADRVAQDKVKAEQVRKDSEAKAQQLSAQKAKAESDAKALAAARQAELERQATEQAKADAAAREAELVAQKQAEAKAKADAANRLKAEQERQAQLVAMKAQEDALAQQRAAQEAQAKAAAEAKLAQEQAAARQKAEQEAQVRVAAKRAQDDAAAKLKAQQELDAKRQAAESVVALPVGKKVVVETAEEPVVKTTVRPSTDFPPAETKTANTTVQVTKTYGSKVPSGSLSPIAAASSASATDKLFAMAAPTGSGASGVSEQVRTLLIATKSTPDQRDVFNKAYEYKTSEYELLPPQVASIQLRRVISVDGSNNYLIYQNPQDERVAKEYFDYHPKHAMVFALYITRMMMLNNGFTDGKTIEKALIDEFTYNFASTPIKPCLNLSLAQDQYSYITHRLSENDRIKFWNWINSARQGNSVVVPSWVTLADVIASQ